MTPLERSGGLCWDVEVRKRNQDPCRPTLLGIHSNPSFAKHEGAGLFFYGSDLSRSETLMISRQDGLRSIEIGFHDLD